MNCDQLRAVEAELALGLLHGEERALALAHIEGCAVCRREVAALADTADELLVLAPSADPSPGFDERVLAEIDRMAIARPARPTVHAWRRTLLAAAAVLAVVLAGVVIGIRATDDGGGTTIRAGMELADGRVVGEVAVADGATAVTVTMDDWIALLRTYGAQIDAPYWLIVERTAGTTEAHRLPPADEHPWTIELDGEPIQRIEIADNNGTTWCSAELSA